MKSFVLVRDNSVKQRFECEVQRIAHTQRCLSVVKQIGWQITCHI